MSSLSTPVLGTRTRRLPRIDSTVAATWALAGGLVLYLGIEGGGYDVVVHSQVGVLVWWLVLVGAAWGLLPVGRPVRVGWIAICLFGGFVAWTALASTWSLSAERSLTELSRVASYLGILLLALSIHRDRERALRHTLGAISLAVVIIAGLAVISRLVPSSFAGAHVTPTFLGGVQKRLNWPLNYWNGLGALVALGVPLLLALTASARSLLVQATACAALPLLVLCGYLTFSRGAAAEAALAVAAFLALAPDRLPKIATVLVSAAGSAILILGAGHRRAIETGLYGHAAAAQGRQLLVALVLVCVGVGVAQVGIGLAARHGTSPRWLRVPPSRARRVFIGAIVVVIGGALIAGAPSRLDHAWNSFKSQSTIPAGPARFGSIGGDSRYDYWRVILQTLPGHDLAGRGPGSFQLVWLPRARTHGYVTNAHSLYVETLNDVGIVGLVLLVGFIVLAAAAALMIAARSSGAVRTHAAGAVGALCAFAVGASVDWVWQLPVLPAAFLLLVAAVFAPAPEPVSLRTPANVGSDRPPPRLPIRLGFMLASLLCLAAIGIPLAAATDVRSSEKAAMAGNAALALRDAESAVRVEGVAASAYLQKALVLESQGDLPAAITAVRVAIHNESLNSDQWLVLARLEAESGHVSAAIAAYQKARVLNPGSPIFAHHVGR